MANGEEENNILDLEEGSGDDTGIDVAEFSNLPKGVMTIDQIITYYLISIHYTSNRMNVK